MESRIGIVSTRTLIQERLDGLAVREALVQEAQDWLEKMAAHTECCGTPLVRRLVAALTSSE